MSLYNLVLFAHVGAAVVLVGGSILATPAIRGAVLRAENAAELRGWLLFGRPLATINPIASLTLVLSGLYLTQAGGWWAAAFVQIALALWVANLLLAGRVVRPALGRLAVAAAAADGPISPELEVLRQSRRWSLGSHALLANDLAVLFLMTNKPGYVASLAVLVVAHTAVYGIAPARKLVRVAVLRRSRAPGDHAPAPAGTAATRTSTGAP